MTTQPRRRWFRFAFSLRTLLVLFTLIAALTAWLANERRQSQHERQIAEWLRQQGFDRIEFGGPNDSLELRSQGEPQGLWRDLIRRVRGERILLLGGVSNIKDVSPLAEQACKH